MLCVGPHLVARLFGRSRWPRRFLSGCASICGVDVRVKGKLANPRSLLLANHNSWLDIPVLASATGCAFVSKAELARQPLLKWLAGQNRTVYVDRSDRRGLHSQTAAVSEALTSDQPLALFPEGTVSGGRGLLPFRPALLSAVSPPPPGCSVQPAAIDYGPATPALAWAKGEHGVANAIRILGRKGRMTATVQLLEPMPPLDRKAMARAAHQAIAEALAPSGIAQPGL